MDEQRKNSTQMERGQRQNNLSRVVQIRAIEGEENKRRFALSFASEAPYSRYWGVEILECSETAVDLKRISEMGCLLFNHNRDKVIGKIVETSIAEGRCEAIVEFDDDDFSEMIYQKVKSGTLKGVSVGYVVNSWEEVAAGKKSADGKWEGPCSIARSWEPLEISIVSVPADATVGVGRDMEQVQPPMLKESKRGLDLYERQLMININNL